MCTKHLRIHADAIATPASDLREFIIHMALKSWLMHLSWKTLVEEYWLRSLSWGIWVEELWPMSLVWGIFAEECLIAPGWGAGKLFQPDVSGSQPEYVCLRSRSPVWLQDGKPECCEVCMFRINYACLRSRLSVWPQSSKRHCHEVCMLPMTVQEVATYERHSRTIVQIIRATNFLKVSKLS